MRYHFTAILWVALHGVTGADDRPIPQDPERQEQSVRDQLEWQRRLWVHGYDRVGKKDMRWDDAVREAMESIALHFAGHTDSVSALKAFSDAATKSIAAGCDDPLLLGLCYRFSPPGALPNIEDRNKRLEDALTALNATDYGPLHQMTILSSVGLDKASSKDANAKEREAAARHLESALACLPKTFQADERNPLNEKAWYDQCVQILKGQHALTGDFKAAFDKIDAELAKEPALSTLRHKFTGYFMIRWAWEARGTAIAPLVKEEGARNFVLRLREARKALNAAWDANPGDARVATNMLSVEVGIGTNREDMEKWFDRAMKADGNCIDACRLKLDWLDPKWHGTYEDMMAFGRACRDTKNDRCGIPLLVVEAHRRLVQFQKTEVRSKHYHSKEFWDDLHTVYGNYLKLYPNAHAERSQFALWCVSSGRIYDADQQFSLLGDRLVYPIGYRKEGVDAARKHAKEKAEPIKKARELMLGACACVVIPGDTDQFSIAGTGAIIDEKQRLLVISNRAIRERDQVSVYFPMYRKEGELVTERQLYPKEGSPVVGKVIARAVKQDLALIQVDSIPPKTKPVPLATGETRVGQRVHIMGCPPGNPHMWLSSPTFVHVLNQGHPPTPGEDKENVPKIDAKYFELGAPTSNGPFSAPVINDNGELTGVMTSFAAAIDVSEISKLIESLKNK